jgi:hypothetical protein
MTTAIVLFLVVGACFGLATYSNRHLFSEGSTRRSDSARGAADGRVMWVLISTGLWPLLALTGLLSLWRLSRVPVRARRPDDERR